MTSPKTILVPTDFGDCANDALDFAITLAARLGARICLLNATRVPMLGATELGAVVTAGTMETQLRASESELHKLAARRTAMEIDTIVRAGDPRDVILAIVSEIHADLIVMGTHGRHGIRRLLLGSVADQIVRNASCPVLTVRHVESPAAQHVPRASS